MLLPTNHQPQVIPMASQMHPIGFQNVYLFMPAYNVEQSIDNLLEQIDDLGYLLQAHQCTLKVRIINDASTDQTAPQIINRITPINTAIELQNNPVNRGNATNIIDGYHWALSHAQDNDLIGCLDADGEHSPLALRRHIDYLAHSSYEGIVGTIIYPEEQISRVDLNMMQFIGRLQSSIMGVTEPFYIQSSGYQLHRLSPLKKVIYELLPSYLDFFSQSKSEPLPRWGMHAVINHLLCLENARLKTVYLECFGAPPNRDQQKLRCQANAALMHLDTIEQFQLAAKGTRL